MRNPYGLVGVTVLLAVLFGSAPAGPPPSQPVGDSAPDASLVELLQHLDVQKELKLSSQQVQSIAQIRKQTLPAKAVSHETLSALGHVLGPEQVRRLEQIHLQQQGLRAFSDPKVEKALRLTDDQKGKIKKIGEEAAKEARLLFRTAARSGFDETVKKIEQVRSKAVAKCVALLTVEQRKSWQESIGSPFEIKSQRPLIRQPDRGPEGSDRHKP